jgi:hypothetical protein
MGNRSESFPGCAQVRTKVHRKDYDWSVGLVYNPRGLTGVTTARAGVPGVLQGAPVSLALAPPNGSVVDIS